MFKKIEQANGRILLININNITRVDLQLGSNSWKIYFVNGPVFDTDSFESVQAAIQWYSDTIGKVENL